MPLSALLERTYLKVIIAFKQDLIRLSPILIVQFYICHYVEVLAYWCKHKLLYVTLSLTFFVSSAQLHSIQFKYRNNIFCLYKRIRYFGNANHVLTMFSSYLQWQSPEQALMQRDLGYEPRRSYWERCPVKRSSSTSLMILQVRF